MNTAESATSLAETIPAARTWDAPSILKLVQVVAPFFKGRTEEELRMRKLELEVAVLERQLGGEQVATVPMDVGTRGMNRLCLVVGAQQSGKSWLLRAAADYAHSFGRPVYWWEPEFCEKPHRPDYAHDWVPGCTVPHGAVVLLDEAWMLYEAGEAIDEKWLRSLFHKDIHVWMGVQNGAFIAPKIWKSGAVAVYFTGSDGIGHKFEREEVADIMPTLARHAVPCRVVSAYTGGAFYVFETA